MTIKYYCFGVHRIHTWETLGQIVKDGATVWRWNSHLFEIIQTILNKVCFWHESYHFTHFHCISELIFSLEVVKEWVGKSPRILFSFSDIPLYGMYLFCIYFSKRQEFCMQLLKILTSLIKAMIQWRKLLWAASKPQKFENMVESLDDDFIL